jgi:hypothetical protein
MELGRSAWIRRERLERIATAERDRRAGRTALAIAALGEAIEWPARAILALALLPESEGRAARRVLEEGLDQWALEAGLSSLDALEIAEAEGAEASSAFEAFPIELDRPLDTSELDRPLDTSELERAFAEAEAQVDEMHDVNSVAERVLFAGDFDLAVLPGEELDPLEESARLAASQVRSRAMDAASVPTPAARALDATSGRPSREVVLATLERWLQNLADNRAGGMR